MADAFDRLRAALAARYKLEREIGFGGMATVYLADDVKHHRKVAVKVLRPELAAAMGADRFLREIEIAARLTHPHILPLYDSGNVKGVLYYVMPYVDGESLRQRLNRDGELPIGEAVRILREVVDALSYAHGQGVVHRDIKPDNVMLSGRHALVTDFGVAKAVSEATGRQTLTTAGVALGTPAYMAPEQAAADPNIDHRVDIYAVGALAYELLAGRTVFDSTTAAGMLAAHVTEKPQAVTVHRESIPPILGDLVMKCLAKKPADRWQSADEMLVPLEVLATTPSGGITPTDTRPIAAVSKAARWPITVGVVAGLLAVGVLAVILARRKADEPIRLGRVERITNARGLEVDPAISPDGKLLAYSAGSPHKMDVYVRQLGGERAANLTAGLEGSHRLPHWSPDGAQIAFVTSLRGVSIARALPYTGGTPRTLLQAGAGEQITGVSWSPTGTGVAYSLAKGGAGRVAVSRPSDPGLQTVAEASDPYSPSWSPDGERIAYASGNSLFVLGEEDFGNIAVSTINVVTPGGRPVVAVSADDGSFNSNPVWTPDGRRLLFVSDRDGGLDMYALTVSRSGAPTNRPERLTTGLNVHGFSLPWDGRVLAYSSWTLLSNVWTTTLGSGSSSSPKQVTSGNEAVEGVDLSPDGRWLLFDSYRNGNQDIYKMRLPDGEAVRLTTNPSSDCCASWSPDAQWIAFHSMRNGSRDIFVIGAEGGAEEQVTKGPEEDHWPRWSPDGGSLAFWRDGTPTRIFIASRTGSGAGWLEPRPVATGQRSAGWAPNGTAIAFLGPSGISLVSPAGGTPRLVVPRDSLSALGRSRWSPDGKVLYYWTQALGAGPSLWSVPSAGGTPTRRVRFDVSAGQVYYGTYAVDATKVFYSMGHHEADLWTADLTGLAKQKR